MADNGLAAHDDCDSNCHGTSRLRGLAIVLPMATVQHVTPFKVVVAFMQSVDIASVDRDSSSLQLYSSLCNSLSIPIPNCFESVIQPLDFGANDTQPEPQTIDHGSTIKDDRDQALPDSPVRRAIQTVITDLYQRKESGSISRFCKALNLDESKVLSQDGSANTIVEESNNTGSPAPRPRKRRMTTARTASRSKRLKSSRTSTPKKRMYCELCGNMFYHHKGDLRRHLQKDHLVPVELTEPGREFDPKAKRCGPFTKNEARQRGKTKEALEAVGRCHIVPKEFRERWRQLKVPEVAAVDENIMGEEELEAAMSAAKKHAKDVANQLANDYAKQLEAYKNAEYFGSGRASNVNGSQSDESDVTDADEDTVDEGVEEDGIDDKKINLEGRIDPRLLNDEAGLDPGAFDLEPASYNSTTNVGYQPINTDLSPWYSNPRQNHAVQEFTSRAAYHPTNAMSYLSHHEWNMDIAIDAFNHDHNLLVDGDDIFSSSPTPVATDGNRDPINQPVIEEEEELDFNDFLVDDCYQTGD